MKTEKICKDCNIYYYKEWVYRWPWRCDTCKKIREKKLREKRKVSKENKVARDRRNKKKYREKHKERLREYNTKYIKDRRNNDEEFYLKHKISYSKRRASIVKWDVTYEQLQQKLIDQEMKCWYCNCDLSLVKKHLDHINPISLWWAHEISNLHWTCAYCNLSKNNKSHEEFIKYRYDKWLHHVS